MPFQHPQVDQYVGRFVNQELDDGAEVPQSMPLDLYLD
jgi:hypothetical protein